MYDINLILLSYRKTELAHEIVAQCCDLATKMSGVSFSFGFSSDCNDLEITYRKMINSTIECGAEARMVSSPDIVERLNFCLNSPKSWTLLLSDDDVFSVNYLRSMVDSTFHAESHVSLINPTSYLLTNSGDPTQIANRLIDDCDIRARYQAFNNLQFRAVSYWGAHRSDCVIKWFNFFKEKGAFPSYADAVLVTLGVLSGACLPTRECTFLSYDMSNWSNLNVSVMSDAKFYDKQEFVLFHELFWCIDTLNLINSLNLLEKIFPEYVVWWAAMMRRMVELYFVRMKALNLDEGRIPDIFLKKVMELFEWFSKINFNNQAEYLLSCFCSLEAEITEFLACLKSPRLIV